MYQQYRHRVFARGMQSVQATPVGSTGGHVAEFIHLPLDGAPVEPLAPPLHHGAKTLNIEAGHRGASATAGPQHLIQAVMKIDQANNGTLCIVMPGARMFRKVVIMLIAPRIDEAPDR